MDLASGEGLRKLGVATCIFVCLDLTMLYSRGVVSTIVAYCVLHVFVLNRYHNGH